MRRILLSELLQYIKDKRKVRIVYAIDKGFQNLESVVDYPITGPVTPISYNAKEGITFERPDGKKETKAPIEIFDPS